MWSDLNLMAFGTIVCKIPFRNTGEKVSEICKVRSVNENKQRRYCMTLHKLFNYSLIITAQTNLGNVFL